MAADRVRDEAERLVAAAIATISSAARSFGTGNRTGAGVATGSAECCVCPVCRTIAAMRDPSGDLAERLASGVGDLATAASSILRTLATRGGRPAEPEPAPAAEGDEFWESLRRRAADAAKSYGRGGATTEPAESTVDEDPWRVATSTDAATAAPSPDVPHQGAAPEPPATPEPSAPAKRVVKKAVKKPAAPPVEPVPAKKAVAKKAVAKKAVKKATPPTG
jgi:hypothetical protein